MVNNSTKEKKEKEIRHEVVEIRRVTRVTAGGKRLRFRSAVIVGDGKGGIGFGKGKANDVSQSVEKAVKKAEKEMMKIKLVEGRTIPFPVEGKYKSALVILKPAKQGRGIIAGGIVRKICRLAGIKDISAKSLGSGNKINKVKATLDALKNFV